MHRYADGVIFLNSFSGLYLGHAGFHIVSAEANRYTSKSVVLVHPSFVCMRSLDRWLLLLSTSRTPRRSNHSSHRQNHTGVKLGRGYIIVKGLTHKTATSILVTCIILM